MASPINMHPLLRVSRVERSIVITAAPVENSKSSAGVAVAFNNEDFKGSTEEITERIAQRFQNALRVLENHITLTAKAR